MDVYINHHNRSADQIAQIIYEGVLWGGVLLPPETPGISILRFRNNSDAVDFLGTVPVPDLSKDDNEKE